MRSQLAIRRPLVFSLFVTIAFVVAIVLVAIAQNVAATPVVEEAIGTLGRSLVVVGALLWLRRLKWHSWLAGPAPQAAWLLILPPLLYLLAVYPPLFTGSYEIPLEEPLHVAMVGLNGLAAGIMEEVVFRGLVLGSLLLTLAPSGRGMWRALAISSIFFSLPHALNVLAGSDPLRTLAQLLWRSSSALSSAP